jgi:pimeloyl-ACP methyl ester carboxylesterase
MKKSTTLPTGLRLSYDDAGAGSPALVFIHGSFANRTHYAPQLEYFSSGHRVVVPDLRGHGDSDRPSGAFGIRDVADDVIAVCEHAGIDRAVLCCHSWPIPLVIAEKKPSLIAGVVMLDGAVLIPQPIRDQLLQLLPALEGPGWVPALQGFLVARNFPFPAPTLKARVADEIAHGPALLAPQMVRDTLSTDWSAQLTAGSYPLLYIHGDIPLEVERLRQLRPDVVFGAVAGAGHYMSLEVPDQVNAMINRFLELMAARVDEQAADTRSTAEPAVA